MKHVLEHYERPNRVGEGSEDGVDGEYFEVVIRLYDDETDTIETRTVRRFEPAW